MDNRVPKVVGGIVAILVLCSCVLIIGAVVIIYRAIESNPYGFDDCRNSGNITGYGRSGKRSL
jgi:hypothetical protein